MATSCTDTVTGPNVEGRLAVTAATIASSVTDFPKPAQDTDTDTPCWTVATTCDGQGKAVLCECI